MKKWRTLSSEYLSRESFLTVRKDRVLTDLGIDIPDFYVVEYPTWVNVIAITEEGHIIIEQQYRHGIDQICSEIPAGCCEEGEQPLDAAKRELKEETGYVGGEWTEYDVYAPNPNTMNNLCHTFLAEGVKKLSEPDQEPTESIAVHLKTKDEVRQMLQDHKIIEGIMAAPLWRYFSEND